MLKTHLQKQNLAWDLHMYRQRSTLDKITKQGKPLEYQTDYYQLPAYKSNDVADSLWLTHAVSERKLSTVLQQKGNSEALYGLSPYISASIVSDLARSFKVNPSLLNASLIIEVPTEFVIYTSSHDVWSPSNMNNTTKEQFAYLGQLTMHVQQSNTHRCTYLAANWEHMDQHTQLETLLAKSKQIALTKTSGQMQQNVVNSHDGRSKNEFVTLYPKTTPQSVFTDTVVDGEEKISTWNEIIIQRNHATKIIGVMMSTSAYELAITQAHKLGNKQAIAALDAIKSAGIPIILCERNSLKVKKTFAPGPAQAWKHLVHMRNFDNLMQTLAENVNMPIEMRKEVVSPALQDAVYLGDLNTVKALIEFGVDVNHNNGMALVTAVYRCDIDAIQILIENNAQLKLCEQDCLHYLNLRPNRHISQLLDRANKASPVDKLKHPIVKI